MITEILLGIVDLATGGAITQIAMSYDERSESDSDSDAPKY